MACDADLRAHVSGPTASTYWRLTSSVTCCIAADRVLFLDVARDRYFALPAAHRQLFASWLSGELLEPPEQCRRFLRDLTEKTSAEVEQLVPGAYAVSMPAAVDAERLAPARLNPGNFLGVGRAVVKAWRDVRTGRLGRILQDRFSTSEVTGTASAVGLKPRLSAFRAARPLVPVPRVCLHDCLALMDWLGPDRRLAQLTFGVAAYPFAAHCWVQADGRKIDDHPESPSRFQPILLLP